MKRYFLSLLSVAVLLTGLAGCKKDLQENPRTFISPENFFNNPESYELAVKGVYTDISGFYEANAMMMREMFSDICAPPSSAFEQALPTYRNAHEPFFYNVREMWSTAYSIIKSANFILSKLPDAPLDDAKKRALMGESRFLRGFAYFQLVQFFGDVPLRKMPVENFSDVTLARSSQAEVYDFILEDLNYAEANLPDAAPQTGRVYKLAATALLAKVYLTMAGFPLNKTEHYADARDKALTVINSGRFTLPDDYSKVFHNTTYTSESIWEQLYEVSSGGNPLHRLTSTAVGYVPLLLPATWFINSFPAGDQRRSWGIQENYMDPNGNKLPPFFQKFVNTDYINTGIGPDGPVAYTIPYLRLAEMYLIAAEAENEMNGPANAYQYINKIRWRARINKADPTNVPDLAGLSKDEFKTTVLMERKWELHLEGSTWTDLKRTNTLSRIQQIRGTTLIHPIGVYNETWYIPDVEITNNNIPQNPAYQ